MAIPKAQDRLQPALLDRLRDDDPANPEEAPEARVISRQKLRDAVLRDLGWLFNTTRPAMDGAWQECGEARRSVLAFGLPAWSGRTASSLEVGVLEAEVRQAIVEHEPRIVASTLQVEALLTDRQLDNHNQISFRISGQLWAQPVPLELILHTNVDLETGRVEVKDLSR
jgi:type VI secretion system protein ImpF